MAESSEDPGAPGPRVRRLHLSVPASTFDRLGALAKANLGPAINEGLRMVHARERQTIATAALEIGLATLERRHGIRGGQP